MFLKVSAEEFIATLAPHEGSLLRVRATSAVSAIVESSDRDHVKSDQEIQIRIRIFAHRRVNHTPGGEIAHGTGSGLICEEVFHGCRPTLFLVLKLTRVEGNQLDKTVGVLLYTCSEEKPVYDSEYRGIYPDP